LKYIAERRTDPLDIASDLAEIERAAQIAKISQRTPIPFKGLCAYCEEASLTLFCSVDCQSDHEKLLRLSKIKGIG
jgi:hypothetical protein